MPGYIRSVKRLARIWPHLSNLREIFDPNFYLRKYPDVARAGVGPFRHYIDYGSKEGRKPYPLFDPEYYSLRRGRRPDFIELPLAEFLRASAEELINPHPLFDCALYLEAHPEIARRGINPLLHYVRSLRGSALRRAELSGFDCVTFTFMDVTLTIAFVKEDRAQEAALGANIVPVWKDPSGKMQFIAPPEQRPFFEAMKYDQLRAQVGERR